MSDQPPIETSGTLPVKNAAPRPGAAALGANHDLPTAVAAKLGA